MDPTIKLSVMVAVGDIIKSEGLCREVKLKIQGNHFSLAFYVLSLGGGDVVLGVCCLETLGPII